MHDAACNRDSYQATLVDITKCIGCRACQVACKQWNDREGEETELDCNLGFQNPATLSAKTLTLITFHELPDEKAPGGLHYLFTMRRCLHCLEPACASACPTTALDRQPDGPVAYDADKCIGCRYCDWACPWGVPTAEWDSLAPKIQKCTHCADRSDQPIPLPAMDRLLRMSESKRYRENIVDAGLRQSLPGRRPTFRNAGRHAAGGAQPDFNPSREICRSHIRRKRGRRHQRVVSVFGAF